jgi:hypothetical protein
MKSQRPFEVLVAGDLFRPGDEWLRIMANPGEESFVKEFHKDVGGGAYCVLPFEARRCCRRRRGCREKGLWMLD